MLRLGLVSVLGAVALSACSGERSLSCDTDERYGTSTSSARVRVPEDLTLPNETDSLVIPSDIDVPVADSPADCLEVPPGFFEEIQRAAEQNP